MARQDPPVCLELVRGWRGWWSAHRVCRRVAAECCFSHRL